MGQPIGVGDILACRVWSVLDEQAAVNTYNYVCSAKVGAGGSDQDMATFLDTAMASFYPGLYPNTVEYRGVQVYFLKRLGLLTSAAPVQSTTGAAVGTATGFPMPRSACSILKYNDGLRGPAHRGRLYLPFISADWQANNGRPNNAFDTYANSFASALLTPITVGTGGNTSTLVWSLIHKVKGAVPIVRGTITVSGVANKFGVLKRRGDYGRANASPI